MYTDSDAFFWERLDSMHILEALQELKSRRRQLSTEVDDLNNKRVRAKTDAEFNSFGVAIRRAQNAQQRINDRIKEIHTLLDRASWKNAVKAIYGTEGYVACCEWIEATWQQTE